MRKQINTYLLVITLLLSALSYSQERDKDTINTDVIQVVKPYTPTISDAFKVKEVPSLDDETTTTKKEVKYNIFSFPVASTFTPAKGKAAVVDKEEPTKLFDNYATLGFGTYTTILGEVYLNHAINRSESVGGYISHHSSQGGIDGLLLDDGFSDSKLKANYSSSTSDMAWNVEAGFLHQKYHWYGLPQPLFDQAFADGIGDVGHTFYAAHLGGDISFEDTYINSGSLLFRRFGDNQGAGENRFKAKTTADIPIGDQTISTTLAFDYLGGKFDGVYSTSNETKYGNFNIGISPTYRLKQDDLTVDLGVTLVYLNDTEFNKNKIYIYPNITASYRMVDEVLIAYGGIQGELIQNSYYGFSQENPFVASNLFITPTDQQYNVFVGLKGKLSHNMSYNLKGKYIADRNKALFRNIPIDTNITTDKAFVYGNSFEIVYDNVSTFGVSGEINVDVNRNFTLGLKAEYFAYNTDDEQEAWNLPDFEGSLFMDYQITKQWFAGLNLFFIGERKDQYFMPSLVTPTTAQTITLDSYFDANAHLGYHINDRFSVFAKANNIANQDYQRWQNFPVQGIQLLAGATYKFDF